MNDEPRIRGAEEEVAPEAMTAYEAALSAGLNRWIETKNVMMVMETALLTFAVRSGLHDWDTCLAIWRADTEKGNDGEA